MSPQDNRLIRLFFIFCFLFFIFCFSCKNENNKIIAMSTQYKEISKGNSGVEYLLVLQEANDSLNFWIKNKIHNPYQLDSLICFNRNNDKLVGALLSEDGIKFFYGVKIKNRWYFFDGATIVLLKEFYPNDAWPLSYNKLHEIAMKEVFSGYLIKDEKGNWVINDKFFEYHFKASWGYYKDNKFITPSTQQEWDSLYIAKALSVWQK